MEDQNDNAPAFESVLYSAEVAEESYPPVRVVKVSASDRDGPGHNAVRYVIGLSIYLSIYQSIFLSIYRFIYLSIQPLTIKSLRCIYLSIFLSFYLSIYLWIYLSSFSIFNHQIFEVDLSLYLYSIILSIYVSIYYFACLSIVQSCQLYKQI